MLSLFLRRKFKDPCFETFVERYVGVCFFLETDGDLRLHRLVGNHRASVKFDSHLFRIFVSDLVMCG
jgi:hypothetical protein